MFPIPDALAAFYLICFFVGLVFVVVSLVMGVGHGVDGGAADAGGHLGGADSGGGVDSGGVDSAGSHGDGTGGHGGAHGGVHVSPFNLSTIMAFLTWFGGAGYLLRAYGGIGGVLSVAVAAVAGLVGGAVVFYFLVRVLLADQRALDPAEYRLEGTVAKVTMPIGDSNTGEIVYAKAGSRRSEGARSVNGESIERGTEVVIVRYERGIAYVEPWESYIARG